jgi:outer membrane protein assembly factor BamB
MLDSFQSKVPTRVAPGQKVAANQKEDETQRSFSIAWRQTTANHGKEVKIDVTANMVVKDASLIAVNIMFNNKEKVGAGEIIEVNGKKITANWKVKARNPGLFTEGSYSAQITFNGTLMATTAAPLKIVAAVDNGDRFESGKK